MANVGDPTPPSNAIATTVNTTRWPHGASAPGSGTLSCSSERGVRVTLSGLRGLRPDIFQYDLVLATRTPADSMSSRPASTGIFDRPGPVHALVESVAEAPLGRRLHAIAGRDHRGPLLGP